MAFRFNRSVDKPFILWYNKIKSYIIEKGKEKMKSNVVIVKRRPLRTLIAIILALGVMCFAFYMNLVASLFYPSTENLFVTLAYIAFWIVFMLAERNCRATMQFSYIVSLITFISAVAGLIWSVAIFAGFRWEELPANLYIAVAMPLLILIFPAQVPFCGINFLEGGGLVDRSFGSELFIFAMALLWLSCSRRALKKIRKTN